jgi:hypothetical protein
MLKCFLACYGFCVGLIALFAVVWLIHSALWDHCKKYRDFWERMSEVDY